MENKILAINAGSSTLKFQLYFMPREKLIVKGMIDKIGKDDAEFVLYIDQHKHTIKNIKLHSPQQAFDYLLEQLLHKNVLTSVDEINSIGHRVAHGGEHFSQSVVIDQNVIETLESLIELAPLHNPVNIEFIKAVTARLPKVNQVAIFDTSFHQSIQKEHFLYAIPHRFYQDDHIRRYGFHGTSHKYVSEICAEKMNKPIEDLNIISCHLGSGASICAIKGGISVNTSMGFTPLAGLMMGTRCGDIDPSILVFIANKHDMDVEEVNQIMINESGLLGVSGVSNDCRAVEQAAKNGNERAQLALDMFVQRIRAFIGSYMVQMGGVDAILFTGGIGENSTSIRSSVCSGLERLGIKVDEDKNAASDTFFQDANGTVSLAIINTNEELMMARETHSIQ
ncbi:acetate/propionate family kinase [Vibrio algarum]|uniref:Acetate kinase n=1 Tax=Vibrio algarum TaxID=3020714 RepID=A0ABT4YUL6_9VIBR|nr:acetate kinase [Vibrio sp. KJ40-1]MDB1125270.1 acetate kinase [Vibrio sp. KJ40-1]